MQEWTPFIGKTTMPKTGSKNHYAVAIVKRTAGCTENQGSWPQANRQHVHIFSQWSGNIKYTISNWSEMLFFWFTTGQTKSALYTVLCMVMQKLGRSYMYKLIALVKILILTGFNLTRASLTVSSSNLILNQFFPLYDILQCIFFKKYCGIIFGNTAHP